MKTASKERKRGDMHTREVNSPVNLQEKVRDNLIDRLYHIRHELLDFIRVCKKSL
jgi:hypothetical protein